MLDCLNHRSTLIWSREAYISNAGCGSHCYTGKGRENWNVLFLKRMVSGESGLGILLCLCVCKVYWLGVVRKTQATNEVTLIYLHYMLPFSQSSLIRSYILYALWQSWLVQSAKPTDVWYEGLGRCSFVNSGDLLLNFTHCIITSTFWVTGTYFRAVSMQCVWSQGTTTTITTTTSDVLEHKWRASLKTILFLYEWFNTEATENKVQF